MGTQVIVGAGPIGSGVARALLSQGEDVVVVTRSGSGPEGARRVAMDAADAVALTEVAAGATAIFNCANPPYNRWATDWPPLAAAMLTAAVDSGAVLVIASNLYGYGRVDQVMTPDLPLAADYSKGKVRAAMWQEALAAHQAGRVRAVEVRASDYVGPGAESHLDRVFPALVAGKRIRVLGDPDAQHGWTHTEDMAATMVAVAVRPDTWGQPWHAPCTAVRSQREALADAAELAGLGAPKVTALPGWQLRMAGVFNPVIRELPEVSYQVERRFVYDDSRTIAELGLVATEWPEVLRRSLVAAGADLRTVSTS
jgi:nucleoside-diphosphate-sugar epimerase